MKFLYALLFAVALVAADDAVTIKQFNDCKDENVAPGCPDGDTECQPIFDTWTQNVAVHCKNAQDSIANLPNTNALPSQDFTDCYKISIPEQKNEFLLEFVYDPSINCAGYGKPYYHGLEGSQKTKKQVEECYTTTCKQDDQNCQLDVSCHRAQSSFNNKRDITCLTEVQGYKNLPDDAMYPFDLRLCNAVQPITNNTMFKKVRECQEKCQTPDDDKHPSDDVTPGGNATIKQFCVAIFVVLVGLLW